MGTSLLIVRTDCIFTFDTDSFVVPMNSELLGIIISKVASDSRRFQHIARFVNGPLNQIISCLSLRAPSKNEGRGNLLDTDSFVVPTSRDSSE